jgi:hypothetical protein
MTLSPNSEGVVSQWEESGLSDVDVGPGALRDADWVRVTVAISGRQPIAVRRSGTLGLDIRPRMDERSAMRPLVAALLVASLPLACSRSDPAATNEALAPGDGWNQVVLDARGRGEALAIMRQASSVPDPEFPRPAPRGVRWSDVPDAAAGAAASVEMAVVRGVALNAPGTKPDPDWRDAFLAKPPAALVGDLADGRERWIFEIKTIRDERGWLAIVRDPDAPPGRVGSIAAEIGVVGQRTAEAKDLVDAFGRQLRELGAKPGFNAD